MSGSKPRIKVNEGTLRPMNLEELYTVLGGLIRRGYGDYQIRYDLDGSHHSVDEVETDEHTGKVILR